MVELTNFLSFFGFFKYLIHIYLIAFAELLLELTLVLLLLFQYFGQEILCSFLLLCVFLCSICKLIYSWRATSKKSLIFLDPILTLLKCQLLSHLFNLILFCFHLLFLVYQISNLGTKIHCGLSTRGNTEIRPQKCVIQCEMIARNISVGLLDVYAHPHILTLFYFSHLSTYLVAVNMKPFHDLDLPGDVWIPNNYIFDRSVFEHDSITFFQKSGSTRFHCHQ